MTRAAPATLECHADGTATITLDSPQFGIAPGQASVCYEGGKVLGGGWITSTSLSEMALAA